MESIGLTGKSVNENSTSIDLKIRHAQVQLLYKQTKTGLIGVLIVALTACFVFWEVIPQWKLILWTASIALLTFIRGCITFAYERKATLSSNIARWALLHVLGTVASGLLWAIPFIFLWPSQQYDFQLVWPIFILPLSAAAVATYYTWTTSYVIFLVLTALPMSLRFFFEGGELYSTLGFLTLFFIGVLLRAGKVMHAASLISFETSLRNEALNTELKEGISIREHLNIQLQQEIAVRKIAEKESIKLSKVFLDGTNPTFIEDLDGQLLDMNYEAINIYGFSKDELLGNSIRILVPKQKQEQFDELIQRCLDGKLVRDVESILQAKDGKKIPVLLTLSLLTNEKNQAFAIATMVSDITEQKNIEKELTKSKALAESANAAKDKFLKIISHDLKSPFNNIIGFSNVLNDKYDSFDDPKRKKCIQHISKSSTEAYDLLENLLTWARTQTDGIIIKKEPINLKELIDTSISTSLINARAKNITVINKVPPELILSIDKNTGLTFIRNIISNAIKFTKEEGQVIIYSKAYKDSISIHISDTGVGMSIEVIDHLFQIGKNTTSRGTNNEKGTGLGLILCKEFIEQNGGTISVKSELNKGSEFIIILPR